MRRYLYAVGIAAVLSCIMKSPVSAEVSIDYSGVVSDYNGENPNAQTDQSQMEVRLGDGVYYSGEQERYLYDISGRTDRVSASVMDGMVVQEQVFIEAEEKVKLTVLLNGKEIDLDDMSAVQDVGRYVVQARNGSGDMENLFSFTIVGRETNQLTEYQLPASFVVAEAFYEESPLETESDRVVFDGEGTYRITYECTRSRKEYTLELVIDRTAPTLQLEGVEDGKISGPVSLTDLEQNATIQGTLEGEAISLEGKTKLTKSGRYRIQVSDAAGNMNSYSFTILIYLNNSSYIFIVLFIFLIIGIVLYLMLCRRNLKIR